MIQNFNKSFFYNNYCMLHNNNITFAVTITIKTKPRNKLFTIRKSQSSCKPIYAFCGTISTY